MLLVLALPICQIFSQCGPLSRNVGHRTMGFTLGDLVPSLDDGPALVSDQQDGLDAFVVPVVQPLGDVLLQIRLHVGVALPQQGANGSGVCGTITRDLFQKGDRSGQEPSRVLPASGMTDATGESSSTV